MSGYNNWCKKGVVMEMLVLLQAVPVFKRFVAASCRFQVLAARLIANLLSELTFRWMSKHLDRNVLL